MASLHLFTDGSRYLAPFHFCSSLVASIVAFELCWLFEVEGHCATDALPQGGWRASISHSLLYKEVDDGVVPAAEAPRDTNHAASCIGVAPSHYSCIRSLTQRGPTHPSHGQPVPADDGPISQTS